MMGGRLTGMLVVAGGAALGVIGTLWLAFAVIGGGMEITAGLLGLSLLALVVLPTLGAGVYLLARGGQEERAGQEAAQLRKVLDVVKTRGQVPVTDLVLELGSTRDQVHDWIHRLVGMGVFSGYVNWDEGMLYSAQASALRELERCKHCGGEVKLAGKGVITCPYCGTEYFLP